MPYNPNLHHRRSIRLKGYDYSQAGAYFITICCQDMKCLFGEVVMEEALNFNEIGNSDFIRAGASTAPTGATMQLNVYGQIAHDEWNILSERFLNVILDVFQIMPNHMHGIIVLKEQATIKIGDIIGAYKSLVAYKCLELFKLQNKIMGKLWQRNYYEHIIRTEDAYENISNYIINNPAKWCKDKFFIK